MSSSQFYYALVLALVLLGGVVLWILARASSHLLVLGWRRSRSPTPVPSGKVLVANDSVKYSSWDRVNTERGEVKYHRLFLQNLENVDLVGRFVLEVLSPTGELDIFVPKTSEDKVENAAEVMGIRVFAGPSGIEVSRDSDRFRLFFSKIAAETGWTVEWRLRRDVDLEVRLWERERDSDLPTKRLFRPVDFTTVKISRDANDEPNVSGRPSSRHIFWFVLVAMALHAALILWVGDIGFGSSYGWVGITGAVVGLSGFFLVRREAAPFSQGFVVPSFVSMRAKVDESKLGSGTSKQEPGSTPSVIPGPPGDMQGGP
jgi:hypothetical protein